MKRFLLILLTLLLTGCTSPGTDNGFHGETSAEETVPQAPVGNPMYRMPDLPEGYTVLPVDAYRIAPWNGLYYTFTEEETGYEVGIASPDGTSYTALYRMDGILRAWFVGESGIFLMDDTGTVTWLDHGGGILGTYSTECDYGDAVQRSMNASLCADDTHLIVSWWTGPESSRNE